jgi:hypothetical protein
MAAAVVEVAEPSSSATNRTMVAVVVVAAAASIHHSCFVAEPVLPGTKEPQVGLNMMTVGRNCCCFHRKMELGKVVVAPSIHCCKTE